MEARYFDTCYSLRFINITPAMADQIKEIVPANMFNVRTNSKDQSLCTVVIELVETLDYDAIEELVCNEFNKISYDIFVSITTKSDSEIIDVPPFVVNLLRRIGGELRFSFTYIDIGV